MSQSRYRWMIVAAGGLLGCVAFGAMFSLPVFLRPIAKDTGWSITGISSAMTIAFVVMAIGSIAWGSLSDRLGPRVVVLTGSIMLAASLALASQTESLLAFQLVFGVLVGGGCAAIFGFIYAGTMPLYSVIARENFPLRMMGTVIGGMAMAGGLGMATGPVLGGLIYDRFASYSWLFIASFCAGAGAFLIALTFKPFPKQQPEPAMVR